MPSIGVCKNVMWKSIKENMKKEKVTMELIILPQRTVAQSILTVIQFTNDNLIKFFL